MQVDILKKKMEINTWFLMILLMKQSTTKKYADAWDGIKNNKCNKWWWSKQLKKDSMKIQFNSNDDLPLNKPLKFLAMIIITRSVFDEGGKFYRQVVLDDIFYEL